MKMQSVLAIAIVIILVLTNLLPSVRPPASSAAPPPTSTPSPAEPPDEPEVIETPPTPIAPPLPFDSQAPDAGDALPPEPPEAISGWFSIVWGDGPPGSGRSETLYMLAEDSGQTVQIVVNESFKWPPGGALALDRKRVIFEGSWLSGPESLTGSNIFFAQGVQLDPTPSIAGADTEAALTGPQPWVSIACKFSDVSAEPKSLSYFQDMYGGSYPGLDHFWREVSYDAVNLVGSDAAGWYTLPQPRSYYVYDRDGDGDDDADLGRLGDDCTAVADPDVYFPDFVGINLMFNSDLDCCAWGGGWGGTLDGQTRGWRATWEPPWAYENMAIISHETGHGFGLPHSSGTYGVTYDNQWDVMSDTWSNCSSSQDPVFGCLGQHTISYHKDMLEWIPVPQKLQVTGTTSVTVTLEQLALPQTANYLMVEIPIFGTHRFYTVEARRNVGYDVKLPGEAVIIHEIDTTRPNRAHVIDIDGNGITGDSGAMWTAGETFAMTEGITVTVVSTTPTGFVVQIITEAPPDSLPPVVSWVAPVGNGGTHQVHDEMVTLEVTATDNVGVTQVHFQRWDAVALEWVDIGDALTPPYTVTVDANDLNEGWNQVNAHAVDEAGNISASPHIWLDSVDCNDAYEPNNSLDEATMVVYGQSYDATICTAGDEDYFIFPGMAGDRVVVDIDAQSTGSFLDPYIFLLDSDGNTIAQNNNAEGSLDSKLGYVLSADDDYYIMVRNAAHPNLGGIDHFYALHLYTDDTPPDIQITTPFNGDWLDPNLVTIVVSTTDSASGVRDVYFWWHDADILDPYWFWLGADSDGSDGWSLDFDTSAWLEQYGGAIASRAHDWANNSRDDFVVNLGIDRTPPSSAVNSLPSESPYLFMVGWAGSDAASGLTDFDVQYQDNGGAWQDFQMGVTSTSAVFSGVVGHTYGFRSRARDVTGNVEAWPTSADTETDVTDTPPPLISGHVRTNTGGAIAGALLEGLPGAPMTDASGYYSGTVPYDWSGTVRPLSAGYPFSPAYRVYSSVTTNFPTQNYTRTISSGAGILLVDDDDNFPDVRGYYSGTLDSLGLTYDVWDTANSDTEPDQTILDQYSSVIWFSGDEYGGFAGPGSAGESNLAAWLDNGNCLYISSQDYLYDRGLTAFMSTYLGLDSYENDNGDYSNVTGQGSVFGGLGPYGLSYPLTDYSDIITPTVSAEQAFIGENGNGAAINKDNGSYGTSFWAFPLEALGAEANRVEAIGAFLNRCGGLNTLILTHVPLSEASAGIPLPITATVTSESQPLTVTLYYSNTGDLSYTSLEMTNSAGNEYAATISGTAVLAPTLRYYIEASNSVSTVVDGPHQVVVTYNLLLPFVVRMNHPSSLQWNGIRSNTHRLAGHYHWTRSKSHTILNYTYVQS